MQTQDLSAAVKQPGPTQTLICAESRPAAQLYSTRPIDTHLLRRTHGKKYAPYGKRLAERILAGNRPFLVRIFVYEPSTDPWPAAKRINARDDSAALILPAGEHPDNFVWPACSAIHVIDYWSEQNIDGLLSALAPALFGQAQNLLSSGTAASITGAGYIDERRRQNQSVAGYERGTSQAGRQQQDRGTASR